MRGAVPLLALGLLLPSLASGARITFDRTVPSRQNLRGGEDVVIVYAIGDSDQIGTFLGVFLEKANRQGFLRVHETLHSTRPVARKSHPPRDPKGMHADVLLHVDEFTCSTEIRSGTGSVSDPDGKRVPRQHRWADAVCRARLEGFASRDPGERLFEFEVRGEGTSPRVESVTAEELSVALEQAARYAAVAAAEEITPRRTRESIPLEEAAPRFSEGMAAIEAGRLAAARQTWESALLESGPAPELHFNLAAVCEALGDLPAAERHFTAARRLAPTVARYRYEDNRFRRRNGLRR